MNPEANVVYYEFPEISFTRETAETFGPEVEVACAKCSVRIAQIPASHLGSTALNEVVSDLQSHPDTNVAVFPFGELSEGLPSALQAAGIEVETLTRGAQPKNLAQIKEGDETAAFGYSSVIASWTLIDQVAREIVGQKPSGPEAEVIGVIQFLTQEDITFDPTKGWDGYPDYAERFAKLWGVES